MAKKEQQKTGEREKEGSSLTPPTPRCTNANCNNVWYYE